MNSRDTFLIHELSKNNFSVIHEFPEEKLTKPGFPESHGFATFFSPPYKGNYSLLFTPPLNILEN